MAKYYTNDEEYILKKEEDKLYIFSWGELEFKDVDDYDEELAEAYGLKDILDTCVEIPKNEVKRRLERHVTYVATTVKQLIESL